MHQMVLGILVTLLIMLGFSLRAEGEKKQGEALPSNPARSSVPPSSAGKTAEISLPALAPAAKEEIEKRLKKLAAAPAPDPKTLLSGAKCYDTGPPNMTDMADFICEKCKTKSLIAKCHVETIEKTRRGVDIIRKKGLDISIDETGFCPVCTEGGNSLSAAGNAAKNEVVLIISYNGAQAARNVMSYMDLKILEAFMDDKDRYADNQEWEHPLKDSVKRLEQLLGVPLEKK